MKSRKQLMGSRLKSPAAVFAMSVAMIFTVLAPPPATAVELGNHANIVSTNPSSNTPHVLDGYVTGFVKIGANTIAVGNFTQVRNPGTNTPTIARNNIFSFNTSTGVINTTFTPEVNGEITDIQPTGDGTTVWIGGGFSQVNGTTTRSVAKLNGASGAKVTAFNPPAFDGRVTQIVLRNNLLYVSGRFTKVGSTPRTLLAALNPTTGALNNDVNVLFEQPRKGSLNLYRMDVSPDGSKLIGIGNFLKVNGEDHKQIVLLDLSGPTATTSNWSTERYAPACSASFDSYMRDVEFSPDGKFFVVVTTGAYFGGTLCDTAARFESSATGSAIQPHWVDYTGGDTLTKVAITDKVIYLGGHQRWLNNPFAGDREGPGAVSREGLAAVDIRNGMPFSWNPGRTRGYGVYQLLADDNGLWIGSDTDRISGYQYRGRMAYLPLAGGKQFPHDNVGNTNNPVFSIGSTETSNNAVLVKRQLSSAGVASSQEIDTGIDWTGVRAAFMVDGILYTARTDGTLMQQSFNGTTFGTAAVVEINRLTDFANELKTMTSMFFDPTTARMYFTLTGSNTLYYRYFNSESQITGAERYTAKANGAAINWSRTQSMFLSGNDLYVADNTGKLTRWDWDAAAGYIKLNTASVVSGPQIDGVNWISRDVFVQAANTAPTQVVQDNPNVAFSTTVTGTSAGFDASDATTTTGTITGYNWDFGDSSTGIGRLAQHTYAAPGTYTVTLKVTTSTGKTGEASRLIRIGASIPGGPVAPDDAYGAKVFNDAPDLYWRLSDLSGTTAVDASGSSNDGTYFRTVNRGTTGALTGVTNPAVTFNGNTSSTYGWISSVNSVTNPGPYSIETWFKTTSTEGGTIASFGNQRSQLSSQHDRKIFLLNSGQLVFGTYPGAEARATSTASYNDNKWHHVVATQGDAGMMLYVDGSLVGNNPATTAENYTGYWKAGAETTWSGTNRTWFIGSLDEFAVYSYPLSTASVQEHYRLGTNQAIPNDSPVADFTVSKAGLRATVDASASSDPDGSVVSYSWDFGDQSTGNGIFTNHDYAEPGTYEITLTVTDNRGATATKKLSVTVVEVPNVMPVADFEVSGTGRAVSVDASASTDSDGTLTGYAWNFGDGTLKTGKTATHTYSADGTFTITLTVTDNRQGTGTKAKTFKAAEVQTLTFVDSVGASISSAAAKVTVPQTVKAGDGLVLFTTSNSTTATLTEPSGVTGWTKLGDESVGGVRTRAYTKVAVTSDAGKQMTLSSDATVKTSLSLMVYRGLATNWIADSAVEVTSSSSATKQAPAVTVAVPGSTIVSYWADKGSIDNSITPPTGDELRDSADGTGSGRMISVSSDHVTMSTGTFAGTTATMGTASARTAMWSLVLNPGNGGGTAPSNEIPTAAFSLGVADLKVSVDGSTSSDPDGQVTSYAWDFGDGTTATGPTATHTYAAPGLISVSLTVADNSGAHSATVTKTATVSAPDPGTGTPLDFVVGAEANRSSAAPALAVPDAVANGDGMLLFATVNSTAVTAQAPTGVTGWTLVDSLNLDGTQTFLYAKAAAGNDGGKTLTLPLTGTAKTALHLLAYRGIAPGWVSDSTIELNRTGGTAKATPNAQSDGKGSLAIAYWADKGSIDNEFTLGTGLVTRGSTAGTGGGRIISAIAQTSDPVAAGPVGGYNATLGTAAARTVVMTVTLKGRLQ
ncbi:PKD domain-containing protein [Paeniglutamicibacter cryotolerans]|uniref:PKD repeat protein n=1 Tax=Paeniglutamicibacter cryotolerans TaxID=670079 RepID=A0A839QPT3_9MICC|nr:PKD domain-containing protein [Paeniglutamicibacter cryotolerans]MBB2995996.1 PKD repeat protein [Paeniglutamicibacter cryotolerans]